ncbi:MAG: hypothetical protein EA376_12545 [Phycisphaeraceae bacterium]|nr:MAG: hypothetical protein EA376_12545 [Phycisphaeraceae bacterium]
MKTRTLRNFIAGVGLAAVATAAPALAEIENVLWTADPGLAPQNDRARLQPNGLAINLAQQFTLPDPTTMHTLAFHGIGTNVNLSIVDEVGLAASDAENVLWSTVGYSSDAINHTWHEFNLGDLDLAAGTYYVVMTSDNSTGGRWSRIGREDTTNVDDRGSALYTFTGGIRTADLEYNFNTNPDHPVFAVRATGTVIPSPGSIAMASIGGILLAGRRRR